jgi:hypothetical protein
MTAPRAERGHGGRSDWRHGWRDWLWRFVLHLGTGVLAVVAHYVVMAVALAAGARPVAASALGFVVGAGVRFHASYKHVFVPTAGVKRIAPRFVLALAVQFVANAALLQALLGIGLGVWWAQLLTTGVLAVATYLVYRLLVFV